MIEIAPSSEIGIATAMMKVDRIDFKKSKTINAANSVHSQI